MIIFTGMSGKKLSSRIPGLASNAQILSVLGYALYRPIIKDELRLINHTDEVYIAASDGVINHIDAKETDPDDPSIHSSNWVRLNVPGKMVEIDSQSDVRQGERYEVHRINDVPGVKVSILLPNITPGKSVHDIYIVFAGTMDPDTIKADLERGGPGHISFAAAKNIIIDKLQEMLQGYEGKFNFHLAGHSLGGAYAQRMFGTILNANNVNSIPQREQSSVFSRVESISLGVKNSAGLGEKEKRYYDIVIQNFEHRKDASKPSLNVAYLMNSYDPVQQTASHSLFEDAKLLERNVAKVSVVKITRHRDSNIVAGGYVVGNIAAFGAAFGFEKHLAAIMAHQNPLLLSATAIGLAIGCVAVGSALGGLFHFLYGGAICHKYLGIESKAAQTTSVSLVHTNDTPKGCAEITRSLGQRSKILSVTVDYGTKATFEHSKQIGTVKEASPLPRSL